MKKIKKRGRKSSWTKRQEALLIKYLRVRDEFRKKLDKIKAKLGKTNREINNRIYYVK